MAEAKFHTDDGYDFVPEGQILHVTQAGEYQTIQDFLTIQGEDGRMYLDERVTGFYADMATLVSKIQFAELQRQFVNLTPAAKDQILAILNDPASQQPK
jgi:hypothetical protein